MPKRFAPLVAVGALIFAASTSTAQITGQPETARDLIHQMSEYYDAKFPNPTREATRSSGYKPFKRYEHFMGKRLGSAADIPAGARTAAFQQLKDLEATSDRGGFPTWFNLGPTNVGGRCLALAVDPTDSDVCYAGFASGGIWKTADGGNTWTPLGDNLPTMSVSAIQIDESNPSTIYIGTGEGWGNIDAIHGVGVLKSTDGGVVWNTTGITEPIANGRDVFMMEYEETTGVLLVAMDNGLYRSTDGADTFVEVMESGDWRDVKLKPGTTDTYYAISRGWSGQGGYRSTDEGQTWTRMENGAPITGLANGRISVTPANPEYVYWSNDVQGNGTLAVYRTTDGGDSWTLRSTPNQDNGQGWYDLVITANPLDEEQVWSGAVAMYRSDNGGSSWTQTAAGVHVDHHAAVFDPSDPQIMWIGCDGGVYKSTNNGQSFFSRNSGLVTTQFYAMNQSMTGANLAFGGTQDNGTWRWTGSTNMVQVLGADGFECEVSNDNLIILAEIQNGSHYRSTNGGSGFQPINNGLSESGPWQTPTHMDYTNSNVVVTGHNTSIFRTTNAGSNWVNVMNGGLGGGRSIEQSWNDTNVFWCVAGVRAFVSTDNGLNWTQTATTPISGGAINDITVHPDDGNTAIICLGTYNPALDKVQITTDGGATWNDLTNNLPGEGAQSITYDFDNPSTIFLGTDLGCYVSFDSGSNWQPFNVGLPYVICDDLRWHPDGFLRVATHGRGIWEVDISDITPTDVGENPSAPKIEPLTMRVLGSPAGEGVETSLRFGLREAGRARIDLFDANGRLVRNLLDREVPAEVDFVIVDTEALSSGIYFARLESGGHSVSKKLVVE